jgi:serine/threonine protein kinase
MSVFDLKEIGINKHFSIDDKNVDFSMIPYEDFKGDIIDSTKNYRCHIIKELSKEVVGGYGILNYAVRYDKNSVIKCVVKKSIDLSFNVLNESILQHISHTTLKKYKLEYMVPKVYDVYKKKNSINFSMERINGDYIHSFLVNSEHIEKSFIFCMLQISLALLVLEKSITLDHRDLRVTNIFVVKNPKEIMFTIDNKTYLYNCDFHICILDFGFACIGTKPTDLNATEEIFRIDQRCFKPGRDLFQLLISILSLDSIKNKFNYSFYNQLAVLLMKDGKNYTNLLNTNKKADLSYITTLDDNFCYEPLLPENFMKTLINLLDTI